MARTLLEITQKELIELAAKHYNVAVCNVHIVEDSLENQARSIATLHLQENQKLSAIRAVQKLTNWGLKASKDFVDDIDFGPRI